MYMREYPNIIAHLNPGTGGDDEFACHLKMFLSLAFEIILPS